MRARKKLALTCLICEHVKSEFQVFAAELFCFFVLLSSLLCT